MTRPPLYPREEDYPRLTLKELEAEIHRLKVRRTIGPDNAAFRKSYESRLFQLDKQRQLRLQETD